MKLSKFSIVCSAIILASACSQIDSSTFSDETLRESTYLEKKKALDWLNANIKDFKLDETATSQLECVAWIRNKGRVPASEYDPSMVGEGQEFMGFQPAYLQENDWYQPIGMGETLQACYRQILSAKGDSICVAAFDEGGGTYIDAPGLVRPFLYVPFDLNIKRLRYYNPSASDQFESFKKCLATIYKVKEDANYDLGDFRTENATTVFLEGFEAAKEYAKRKGARNLYFEGTGALARSLTIKVNPIELQSISILKDGEKVKIGEILPEKVHLKTLKSPDEILEEISSMVDKALD